MYLRTTITTDIITEANRTFESSLVISEGIPLNNFGKDNTPKIKKGIKNSSLLSIILGKYKYILILLLYVVTEIDKRMMKMFQCEVCKMNYIGKTMAERCEDWCRKNSSCNSEITMHAIK